MENAFTGMPQRYYAQGSGIPNSWGFQNSWGNPNLGYPMWNGQPVIGGDTMQPAVAPAPSILSPEDIERLNKLNSIEYKVSPDELARYMCDHKEGTTFIAKVNEDGMFYCPRCGRTFTISRNGEEIDSVLGSLGRVIEGIKLLNSGTISVDVIRALVTSYAILDKGLKPVYDVTYDSWKRSMAPTNNDAMNMYQSPYGYGSVGTVMTNIRDSGNSYVPYGAYYGQQPYNMYAPNQVVPQQTVNPQAQVVGNPFNNNGVYAPNPYAGYNPQQPAYNYGYMQPQQPAPVVAPQPQVAPVVPPVPGVANITANPTIPAAAPVVPPQPTAVQIPPAMSAPTVTPQGNNPTTNSNG